MEGDAGRDLADDLDRGAGKEAGADFARDTASVVFLEEGRVSGVVRFVVFH